MFENAEALRIDQHRALRYRPVPGFAFARAQQTVPLTVSELIEAAKHFPIVLPLDGQGDLPLALLGLSAARNDFVDLHGHWTAPYVPAHVRRYPFILGQTTGEGQYAVMVALDAPHFAPGDGIDAGQELFDDDGEPAPVLRRIMNFLGEYQKEVALSRQVVRALREAQVLSPYEIATGSGETRRVLVRGFAAVQAQRFDALADDTFLDWRRRGLLPLVYAHLASLGNVARLQRGDG